MKTMPRASLVAQTVKNLPAMHETQIQSLVGKIPWRRERPPAPVFLPEEFSGQRSLAGYIPWDLKELDTTEQLSLSISRLCQSGVPPYCSKYIKIKLSFA